MSAGADLALERWENEGGRTEAAFTDAVCGTIVAERSPHRHRHDGRTYHFCSERCRSAFAADPLAYLAPGSARAPGAPRPARTAHQHE